MDYSSIIQAILIYRYAKCVSIGTVLELLFYTLHSPFFSEHESDILNSLERRVVVSTCVHQKGEYNSLQ